MNRSEPVIPGTFAAVSILAAASAVLVVGVVGALVGLYTLAAWAFHAV